MAYKIKYTTHFIAIHALPGIVDAPHPHQWILEAQFLVTELSANGISLNYFDIKTTSAQCLPEPNSDLNALFDFMPTAENLSKYYYDLLKPVFPMLQTIAVGEFPEFMCYYQR